ncbi:FAD-dependent oxidoreductase [Streptomyces sp. RB6PN25]|uniref:FAD-dependent oxidoreductase n=1 Tax=Streptomyces humicola TaxID=2953240 RepID=A0ABT1PND5_9ACTN|nr:FAD-dependent oxidoreductase [Streptomyces humicola]MCQ4079197.1 FAD-dependent oxidoreductase [Streptomyces humicola]
MEKDGLVVVGASLAGLRAVESARRLGYSGRITLIGAEEHLPYDRPPLSKEFLASGEPVDPVFRAERALREELGVDLRLGRYATGLDCRQRVVRLGDEEVSYSALVIATGAQARTLPDTAGLRGVHALRTLDDARSVREALDAGARTVIVGAGFIGSEVASAARKRGLPVTLVEAATVPLTRSVGSEMGGLLAELHRRQGVDLRLGAGVQRIDGSGSAESVVLTNGAEIPADLVVVGIGAAPCTGWLEGSGIDLDPRDKGVLCDSTLAVNAPGVYAAGDVCHWISDLFRGRLRLEHWTSAAEQGSLAARNALSLDDAKPYDTVPYFWSDWYDSRIQFVGEPHADDIQVVDKEWEDGKLLALYRKADRLVAALTVNRPTLIMKLRRMIASRASWQEAVEFAEEKVRN